MTETTRNKIAKVYELVQRGVDGEQKAAQKALERLLKKHNLNGAQIENIRKKEYRFKYGNRLELMLCYQLVRCLFPGMETKLYKDTYGVREIVISFEYLDYVTFSTAYEYFRRHMKAQFKIHCTPLVNKCRSAKTRNERREQLQDLFFGQYAIASKLYVTGDLTKVSHDEMSKKKMQDLQKLQSIEGGSYHTQVTTGLYLNQ
ncbi:hypothetical protein [Aquimarina latercula]|uniref:hypothetical protein n=1 Tax=Aquimarina latercula TaxID=987 RepID=UPI0003FA2C31|nr:hypothetical protein [Aquimarina latercula]